VTVTVDYALAQVALMPLLGIDYTPGAAAAITMAVIAQLAGILALAGGVTSVLPSEGNFVTFRTCQRAEEVHAAFLRRGIRIRNVSHVMEDGYWSRVSVTAGSAETDLFAAAAAEVVGQPPQ
jgi:histidinol-phosphate/aromatic aminotransferase/cobyric acid decarboxylase-like protein